MSVLVVLVWFHVLSVIMWFGGSAMMAFVIGPSIESAGSAAQPLVTVVAANAHRYFAIAGGVAILSGLALAGLEGRFGSPLIGTVIVLAVFLAVWGARVTGRAADAIGAAPTESTRAAAIARMKRVGTIEILGLTIAFTLMILVRFGY